MNNEKKGLINRKVLVALVGIIFVCGTGMASSNVWAGLGLFGVGYIVSLVE